MTVNDLKNVVNSLPPQFGDFKVEFVDQVERVANGFYRQDRPIFGSLVDEHSKEFLLAHGKQFDQLKAYAQQGPNPGSNPEQHLSTFNPDSGPKNRTGT